MTIREHAERRHQAWLKEHGKDEYDRHDLVAEALEEMADAWNYLTAELDRHPQDGGLYWARERVREAYEYLESRP